LRIAVRHEPVAVGLIQASSVIPFVRSRPVESGTFTMLLVPLNVSAAPKRPAGAQAVFTRVPLLPVPEWSTVVVPKPSSKP
jgi:hypothetical protein